MSASREKQRIYSARYRAKIPREELRKIWRLSRAKWVAKNKEKAREADRRYYVTHREEIRLKSKPRSAAYRIKNREKIRLANRKYYSKPSVIVARTAYSIAHTKLLKTCPHCNGEVSIKAWRRRIENERQLTNQSPSALEKASRRIQSSRGISSKRKPGRVREARGHGRAANRAKRSHRKSPARK